MLILTFPDRVIDGLMNSVVANNRLSGNPVDNWLEPLSGPKPILNKHHFVGDTFNIKSLFYRQFKDNI